MYIFFFLWMDRYMFLGKIHMEFWFTQVNNGTQYLHRFTPSIYNQFEHWVKEYNLHLMGDCDILIFAFHQIII